MGDTIHVCYAMHDRRGAFSKFVGTSICSVFRNTRAQVVIHLLHDHTLTDGNRERFLRLAASHGQGIRFYDLDALAPESLARAERALGASRSRYSIAMLYRLLLPQLLPTDIGRAIYLDADTMAHMEIRSLWEEPVGPNGLAAVPEHGITEGQMVPKFLCKAGIVPERDYFNSGVLLMDLARMRSAGDVLSAGTEVMARYPACYCYDQDILNYFFAKGYRKLPLRCNVFVVREQRKRDAACRQGSAAGDAPLQEAIYHFAGNCLRMDLGDPWSRLFFRCFVETPWHDLDFLGRAFAGMGQMERQRTEKLRRMANLFSRKRRVVIGLARYEGLLRELLEMQPGERYVSELDLGSFRFEPGMVAVLFTGEYESLRQPLEAQGCREGEDFVDGREIFCRGEEGAILDDYDVFSQW